MNAYGKVAEILNKIKSASVPEKFTFNFLETILGFKSSSDRPVIVLLKKIGFITSDGSPTEAYQQFRNSAKSRKVMADAIKKAYEELYKINEHIHAATHQELKETIIQCTGLEQNSKVVSAIVGTFEALKGFANFDLESNGIIIEDERVAALPSTQITQHDFRPQNTFQLGYTINLNLPESKDPEVFHAIFESLKKHLLS